MDPLSVGGGELIGVKKLTNNQSWKILTASAEAFCSKNVKLEDPVPDQPLQFPASNFSAFTVGFRVHAWRLGLGFRVIVSIWFSTS